MDGGKPVLDLTDAEWAAMHAGRRSWERWSQHGGSGALPSYAGRAADMNVHFALCGMVRLLVVTHLAAHGAATIPEFALLYGWPRTRLRHKLTGLARLGLVEAFTAARPVGWEHRRTWNRQPAWRITESGRRWLWRFGWVTRRLCMPDSRYPPPPDWPGEDAADPVDALQRGVQPELLRPAAMAVAMELRWYGPLAYEELRQSLNGLPTAQCHLTRFATRGWVEKAVLRGTPRRYVKPRPRWRFTEAGKAAMARHAAALWRASEASGHRPDVEDCYFPYGPDGEGYEEHFG